ncbi:MAG TPA: TetR/AcrR family transcriptional regulator [Thermomonas sp.]|nr:TetR/AcrR family transcriptional regulator [Thermomonas sp.]
MPLQPRHLPADERRAATVQAVVHLAAAQNPQAITTQAIADHMGVTQGALFRHFPNKDAILGGVMGWISERLLDRVDRAADGAPTTLVALQAMFDSHIAFVTEHPGVPRMLFGELQHSTPTPARRMARTLIERYSQRLHALVERGIASGELNPSIEPAAAAALFIGTIQGLVMQSMLVGDVGHMRRQAPGAFAILLGGLEARP